MHYDMFRYYYVSVLHLYGSSVTMTLGFGLGIGIILYFVKYWSI